MVLLGSSKVCNREDLLNVFLGKAQADTCVVGGKLVNVNSGEIYGADIAIYKGRIVSVGRIDDVTGKYTKTIDAEGKYLTPGLIDTHLHFYHSYLNMTEFAKAMLAQGVTVTADGFYGPAIVSGMRAVRALREEVLNTPLKMIFLVGVIAYSQNRILGLPPNPNGLSADDLKEILSWPDCIGLEEPQPLSVTDGEQAHIEIYKMALRLGKVITGHAAALPSSQLRTYVALGTSTDHECEHTNEAIEKARLGLKILARQGTGWAANVSELVKAITEHKLDSRCFAFCTDGIPPDVLDFGGLPAAVRKAISQGLNPITAIQIATLNAAELFRIDNEIGSIAPGKIADIVVVDDLPEFRISSVIANGHVVFRDDRFVVDIQRPTYPEWMKNTVKLKRMILPQDLDIPVVGDKTEVDARVIFMPVGSIITTEKRVNLPVTNGVILPRINGDVIKISMIDRFDREAIGNGFVEGLGLKEGAYGVTVNAVCQNIIVAGTNSDDMSRVANRLAEVGGGMVVVSDGRIRSEVRLPLYGLLSDEALNIFTAKTKLLYKTLKEMGWKHESIDTLDWIGAAGDTPFLRISAYGLLDVPKRKIVNVVYD